MKRRKEGKKGGENDKIKEGRKKDWYLDISF